MRKSNEIDGTPDEVKVSCPVWREGKSGDYFKGLPITIGHHFRWLCPQQPDRRGAVQSPGQPHRPVGLREPWQERPQSEFADDGACPSHPGRAEIHPQGQLHCHENWHSPHANPPSTLPGLGHHIWSAIHRAGASQSRGGICQPCGSGTEPPPIQQVRRAGCNLEPNCGQEEIQPHENLWR